MTTLLVLTAVSSSYAHFRGILKNTKLAEELKLSDEQIETIKESSQKIEKQMIKLRADMEMKEIDLRDVMDEEKPDEDKAIALVKAIMELKTEQRILHIKEMITLKKTLTTEQIEKLHEFKHEHHARDKRMMKGKEGRKGAPPKREGPPPE